MPLDETVNSGPFDETRTIQHFALKYGVTLHSSDFRSERHRIGRFSRLTRFFLNFFPSRFQELFTDDSCSKEISNSLQSRDTIQYREEWRASLNHLRSQRSPILQWRRQWEWSFRLVSWEDRTPVILSDISSPLHRSSHQVFAAIRFSQPFLFVYHSIFKC